MDSASGERAPGPAAGLEARIGRLRALTEVSRALTYATSIGEVLALAVERAAELMDTDRALLMLTDADGLLAVRAAYGLELESLAQFRAPLSESLVRQLQGVLGYPSLDCFLSVPLVVQGQVTGLLAAVRPAGREASAEDEWLLSALADQAAVALENARLTEAAQQARAETERSERARGHVQATLSHELRSPLNSIQSYCALLLEGVYGPLSDRQRESVARIRTSGHYLLEILENVLEAARPKTGAARLRLEDFDLAALLADAFAILQPLAVQKRQELRRGEMADGFWVRADRARLMQALLNVAGNAIKYTPEGGTVRVGLQRTSLAGRQLAALAITDSGPGIPAEALPSLFEPYRRGSGSPGPGLGLGLHIARVLLRQMDGDVKVSTEPGKGSTFTLLLPLAG